MARQETILEGLPLSPGVAVARVCRFNENRHSNLKIYKVFTNAGVENEIARFERATKIAVDRIDVIKAQAVEKIGKAEAEIFTAQRMIAEDPKLHSRIAELIRKEKTNAEAAIMVILDSYEARMREVDDEYIRDRASDIGEIKRRLLDVLSNINPEFQCSTNEHCQHGKNRIIITKELTPSMTMEMDASSVQGFVTEHGGINSHSAILARALGIPAVSRIKNAHKDIMCGTEVIVDGNEGRIILWPTEATITKAKKSIHKKEILATEPLPGLEVMANISLASEINEVLKAKAEGIGLFRTEFEFVSESRLLNEDEQYEKYASVVKAMNGLPVTFRLFDAGGDKPMPFLDIPKEDNPALGWRGARLLLGNPLLMKTQSRALARASEHGPIKILYPMITDLEQFLELRKIFDEATAEIKTGEIGHGPMFEVPSACLDSERLLKHADFGSIGTNDLLQYLFAVDRNNEMVSGDYSPDKEVFWVLIKRMVKDAKEANKPLSVCGELAGNKIFLKKLIKIGINSISVSTILIPGIRLAAKKNSKQ